MGTRPANVFTDIAAAIEEAEWLAAHEKRQHYVVQRGHEMFVTHFLQGSMRTMYRTRKRR